MGSFSIHIVGVLVALAMVASPARAGIIFSDNFNRPNGSVGNGWSTWWGTSFGHPNINITNGELQTAGFPNFAGGVVRTLPVTFPLEFAFDFRTFNLRDDQDPSLPFNDGGWEIFFNANPTGSPSPHQSPAQLSLVHTAGSRNLTRGYFDGTTMVYHSAPGLSEPIPGQRDYRPTSIAHIEGLINSDLSTVVRVFYNDGATSDPVTFSFGAVAGPIGAAPGSELILANANRSFGPHLFDNLEIRSMEAVPEPSSLVLLGTGALGCAGYLWRWKRNQQRG